MKKWLENFWYYHKWATIITVVIALCLIFAWRGLIPQESANDLEIALIGTNIQMDDMEKNTRTVEGIIRDLDGDGAENVLCRTMIFTGNDANDSALYQRLMTDLAAGESRVYLVQEAYVNYLMMADVLMPLEDEVTDAALLKDGIRNEEDRVVALPVTNVRLPEQMGLHLPEDTYIGVRPITPTEQDENGIQEKEENALLFFHACIK